MRKAWFYAQITLLSMVGIMIGMGVVAAGRAVKERV
jgi:uncharacterized membrane-anchored protein YhcB (DUF1043 family)